MKGILISFEGVDGSGKSTQSRRLYHWLRRIGYDTIHLEEPGGSNLGESVKKILLYSKGEIEGLSELFLFFACRAQLVKETILPSLKKGKILIIDRFSDSTLAYQGYGRGIDKGLIVRLNKIVTKGITPDLTILLDERPKAALKRTKSRKGQKSSLSADRFENEPLSFHQRVRKGYLKIALCNKKRIKIIPVRADEDDTFQEIKKAVLPLLTKMT
ncbi:MAG: dTMP kinase [Candidatus Omnitrophica bacterium]|nr:dTMP kinase [Candidatus Omnitrophota bacterium]